MDNRQQRIQLLSRMNRGRAAAPSLLATLSETLGEVVEADALVPLLSTDRLMEMFRSGYRNALENSATSYRRFFLPDEKSLVLGLADCLADRLPTEKGFFLTKLSEDCGAIEVGIAALLRHAASVIRLDGNSLSVLSSDHTQGLLIDYNADEPKEAYEVAIWGERWPLIALGCDRR